jgi:hypothetical protein
MSFVICTAGLLGLVSSAANAADNPFRPAFCGQCTDGAWIYWCQRLGHAKTPSVRHAKYWWDGAATGGYERSSAPGTVPCILVIDGWSANQFGHVAVVTYATKDWSPGWYLLWTQQFNYSPSTAGNCNAKFQGFWVAYHPSSRSCWYWQGQSWSRTSFPVRGFVWGGP